jgi:hypothetical protein
VGEHLTAAAELEQALKEERWGDVGTWSQALARFEPAPPVRVIRYVIRYTGPDAKLPTYWVGAPAMRGTTVPEAATRYATPESAAREVPPVWFSPMGEARFAIEEVTD